MLRRSLAFTASLLVAAGAGCSSPEEDSGAPPVKEAVVEAALQGAAPSSVPPVSQTVANQYIVVLHANRLAARTEGVAEVAALMVKEASGELLFTYDRALTGFAAKLGKSEVQRLRADPRVDYIVEDMIVERNAAPWGLDRIDQRTLPLDGLYEPAPLPRYATRIYVIDTGIDVAHLSFAGLASNIQVTGTPPALCGGHGTHVAATAAGFMFGVAPGATLIGTSVGCGGITVSSVIAAFNWIISNHVKPAVVLIALGSAVNSALDSAASNTVSAGVTVVASAGNGPANACNQSPGRAPSLITVAASTSTDAAASFSNFGTCVDLYAPGVSVESAWSPGGGTMILSGTSMSAAHVAGAAARHLNNVPTATPAAVASALTGGATNGVLSAVPSGTPNRLLHVP